MPSKTPNTSKEVTALRRLWQGFGSPAGNARIERAAVGAAERYFRSRGWNVKSRENDNCGYDLECRKARQELHVEVKGIGGDALRFILTAGEWKCALSDRSSRIALVVDALKKPWVRVYSRKELMSRFGMKPLAYRVAPVQD